MDWARHGPGWPLKEASRFVRCGRIEWHVQDIGAGDAVLFLHGAGASGHSWRDVLPIVGADARAISLDLPGHGFTRNRARGRFGLDEMAADTRALLDMLEVRPRLIVGHSAGAAVALRMALGRDAPPAVLAFNPALGNFTGLAGWLFPFMAKLLSLNPLTAIVFSKTTTRENAARLIRGTGSVISTEGVELYYRLMCDRDHVDGALAMMSQWKLDGLTADLAKVGFPVRFVIGGRDEAVPPSTMRDAAARIPGATVEDWPEAGHLAHEERPEEAAAAILAMLRGGDQRG